WNVFLEAQLIHQTRDRRTAEAPHQLVFQRHEETRRTRIALAAGATAQLVIDASCLVPLSTQDMQPTEQSHAVGIPLTLRVGFVPRRLALFGSGPLQADALPLQVRFDETVGIATQQDIDAATCHVRRDGDGAWTSRLGNDPRLALVLLGVEHLVR